MSDDRHDRTTAIPRTTILLVLALAFAGAGLQGAGMPEPISYLLRFPAPQTHYVEVEARIPTGGRAEVELMMAVWTPGSYLVREYSRNVEDVAAATGGGRAAGGREDASRTAGGSRRTAGPHGGRPLPGLLPRDVGAHQLRRRRSSPS